MPTFRGLFNDSPIVTGEEIIGQDFDASGLGDVSGGLWGSQGVKLKAPFPLVKHKYVCNQQQADMFYGFTAPGLVSNDGWASPNFAAQIKASVGGLGLTSDGLRVRKTSAYAVSTLSIIGDPFVIASNIKYMFAIVVRQVGASNTGPTVNIGDALGTGPGFNLITSGGFFTINATNYLEYPALTVSASILGDGQDFCLLCTGDLTAGSEAGDIYFYGTTDGAETAAATATFPAPPAPANLKNSSVSMSTYSTSEFYGIYMWRFTGGFLPSAAELAAGAKWMAENPNDGPFRTFWSYA